MRGLIRLLKEHPEYEKVFFNEKGEWLFDPNKLHPTVKTRQEILDMEDSLPAEEVSKDELATIKEQYALLQEKIDLLEVENQILSEGKNDSEEWAKERAAYQEKIKALETQLSEVKVKNKKFNGAS